MVKTLFISFFFSDNPEGSNKKEDCEKNGDFFCECDGTCISKDQRCDGNNDCCGTYHGIGTTNVTCADHHHDLTFKAPDEQNCNVGKTETEYLMDMVYNFICKA